MLTLLPMISGIVIAILLINYSFKFFIYIFDKIHLLTMKRLLNKNDFNEYRKSYKPLIKKI